MTDERSMAAASVAIKTPCLTVDQLRDFVLGQTDEETSELIAAHLADCLSCEETVASLDDTADSLVVSLRDERDAETAGMPAARDGAGLGGGRRSGERGYGTPRSDDSGRARGDDENAVLASALSNIRSRFPESAVDEVPGPVDRIVERVRDYELLEKLGSGGMGTVYRAVHTRLERVVALKLLPARKLRNDAAVGRFEREMKAIGRLDHPAIVRATDAGEVDGTHFLAMDLVDGIDLARLVRHSGPLDVASACEVIRQAAVGLDYAHRQGLIHRDVKPSNLMLDRAGNVRILDLGLALFGAASEAVDELTTVGQLMGTLDYMAPEQADNSHEVDARADVYSLGATLFKLLTGATVYEAPDRRTPLSRMRALATLDAPSITTRRDDLPSGLVSLIDGMLLRDAKQRPASAAEVAEALTEFCEGAKLAELSGNFGEANGHELRVEGEAVSPFASRKAAVDDATRSRGRQDAGDCGTGVKRPKSRTLANVAVAAILLLAGIVIWLQTDNGTLLIEADERVAVEIRRVGGNVERETLNVGQNALTIRSGDYEIVLPKEYDALKVENGTFELSRGGTWIARVTKQPPRDTALGAESPPGTAKSQPGISQAVGADATESRATVADAARLMANEPLVSETSVPSSAPLARALSPDVDDPVTPVLPQVRVAAGLSETVPMPAAMAPGAEPVTILKIEPVFSGKTFDDWKRVILTERNPDELQTAVEAFGRLGRGRRDREAAETILGILAPYGPDGLSFQRYDRSVLSSDQQLQRKAVSQLQRLNPDELAVVATQVMRDDDPALRRLVLEQFALTNSYPIGEKLRGSSEFLLEVANAWPSLEATSQSFAFQYLTRFWRTADKLPPLKELLNGLAQDTHGDHFISAIRLRIEISPDDVGALPGRLFEFLEDPDGPTPGITGKGPPHWTLREGDAWLGLAALPKPIAAPYAARIAGLLEKANGKLPGRALDDPGDLGGEDFPQQQMQPAFQQSRSDENVLTKRMLIYELLGRIGPLAAAQTGILINEVESQLGVRPDPTGDYGFVAAEPKFALDVPTFPFAIDLRTRVSDPRLNDRRFQTATSRTPATGNRVGNSLLHALHQITGQPVRFGEDSVFLYDGPPRSKTEPRGLLVALDPTSQRQVALAEPAPGLVSYRSLTFDDWLSMEPSKNGQWKPTIRALQVLSTSNRDEEILNAMARHLRLLLDTEDFWKDGVAINNDATQAGHAAAEWLLRFKPELLDSSLTESLSSGVPRARISVLRAFAAPTFRTEGLDWPVTSSISKWLGESDQFQTAFETRDTPASKAPHEPGESDQFQTAFETLLKEPLKLPPDVINAAIHFCSRRAESRSLSTVLRLAPLLDSDDKAIRARAAIATARLVGELLSQPVASSVVREATANNVRLFRLLIETLEAPPDGVELVEVAMALRQITDRARWVEAGPRLMALLRQDCQAGQATLFTVKLAPRPAIATLKQLDPELAGISDDQLASFSTEPHTISRRTLISGLLLHAVQFGSTPERADLVKGLPDVVAAWTAAGNEPVEAIAPNDADRSPHAAFLWQNNSILRGFSDDLRRLSSGTYAGIQIHSEPGGDAATEAKAFREQLGLLLGRQAAHASAVR